MTLTRESVQQLIDSEHFGERIKGINQLRQLDPKIAFEMIQPLVTDKNPRIRYAAVSQLDPLGQQDLGKALELLLDRLRYDPEMDVQAAAADALAGLKLSEAFEDLSLAYHKSSEWLVQLSIIAALGEFGDPRGFDLLQDAITSSNSLIKTAAISSLGELGDPRGIPLLLPFVNDEDWQIRHRIAQAFGNLNCEESEAILSQLAADPMEQVAREAQFQISRRG